MNGRLGQELLDTVDRQVASDAGGGELRRHGDLLPDPESLTDQFGHCAQLAGVEVDGSQEQHFSGGLGPADQPH